MFWPASGTLETMAAITPAEDAALRKKWFGTPLDLGSYGRYIIWGLIAAGGEPTRSPVGAVAPADDPARAASAPRLPPIGRLIEPEEVAACVSYLCSDAAGAVNGPSVILDGGTIQQ